MSLTDTFSGFAEAVQIAAMAPLFQLLSPGSGLSLLYLLITALILCGVYSPTKQRTTRSLVGFLLPKDIYLHPSAKLDYAFFVISSFVRMLTYGAFILGAAFWAGLIADHFSLENGLALSPGVIAAVATVVYVLGFDLGYWFAHWLGHVNPVLWQFHKIHHEAEVLTPFTALRTHPVDDLLTITFTSLGAGVGLGLLDAITVGDITPITFLGVNALFLLYYVTLYNLRHTHHYLIGPRWLGWIVQSPAHHQVHHSTDPRHYDRNFAFGLTIWDRAFGTLFTPEKDDRLTFGVIGSPPSEGRTVLNLYSQPFIDAWAVIRSEKSSTGSAETSGEAGGLLPIPQPRQES